MVLTTKCRAFFFGNDAEQINVRLRHPPDDDAGKDNIRDAIEQEL